MRHTVTNRIVRSLARAAWRIRRGERVWLVFSNQQGWIVL